MHKKLFLHIGTPKTGKTSLQYFCENNRKTLMDKGILYPENPNGYVNTNYIFKDGVTPKEAAGNFKKLCENSSRIFMSAEAIWWWMGNDRERTMGFFQELKDSDIDIKVIVYIRPQEEYIESLIKQHIDDDFFTTP